MKENNHTTQQNPQFGGREIRARRNPDRGVGDLRRAFQVDFAVASDARFERTAAECPVERAAAADGQLRLPGVYRHRAGEFGVAVDAHRQRVGGQRTADAGAAADLDREVGGFDVVREFGVTAHCQFAAVAALHGSLRRSVARNPQLAVAAAHRACEFAVARHVEFRGAGRVDVGAHRSVARYGDRNRRTFQRHFAVHLAVGACRYFAQRGRCGNGDRDRDVFRAVGVDAEFQLSAVALQHQIVDDVVVGLH